jgi:hypothetical protein
MITLVSMLEKENDLTFEHLCWRQMKGAYQCNLISVGYDCDTMEEALDMTVGTRVFMIPPGRVDHSIDMADYTPPTGDVVYIFGRPGDNLVSYVREEDTVVHITTPVIVDMMAVTVAGIILYEYGQQN